MYKKSPTRWSFSLTPLFRFIHHLPASDRVLFHGLFAILIISGLWSLVAWNTDHLQTVPARDGTLREGLVGTARFINPVLANTRVDRDLAALVFQGVLRIDEDGELVPDLARSIERNEDGTSYEITLRQNAQFHDGQPVTARDVVFTYQLLQNPDLMSPWRGNWSNVTIEQTGTFSIRLTLAEAYHPFLENLTLGILPAHIWEQIPVGDIAFSTRNTNPIGSGPYVVYDTIRDESGSITAFNLQTTDRSQTPIATIYAKLFPDQEALFTALQNGHLDATAALAPAQLHRLDTTTYHIHTTPLPRVITLVFNQNRSPAVRNAAAREALEMMLDRDHLVKVATANTGIPNTTPIPSEYSMLESLATSSLDLHTNTASSGAAVRILQAGGWEQTEDGVWERDTTDGTIPLSITLRTINQPSFSAAATVIAEAWRSIGIEVQVEEFSSRDFLDGIARPRDFEALLYGMDVSRSVDLYPFWHSSQQTDPGLNLAQYTSIRVDDYLSSLRTEFDVSTRAEITTALVQNLQTERPALFLYTPTLSYVVRDNIVVTIPARVQTISDRWQLISQWHSATEDVWPWIRTSVQTTENMYLPESPYSTSTHSTSSETE